MRLSFSGLAILAATCISRTVAVGLTDTYADADLGQSGYLRNHNMDPAVVDSSAFGQLWRMAFNPQEQFYAKPLVYTPLAGGPQILFLASSQNWIRTLDAKTGAVINAGRQVKPPFLQSDIGCTDIANTIGIIGTPVIDPATDIAYFFAKTYIPNFRYAGNTGTYNGVYYFYAVNVNTLADVPGYPILVDGAVADNDPRKYFVGGIVLQRPSLTQVGSVVYGAFGGHCDLFNYTGLVMGIDINLKKVVTQFVTEAGPLVPNTGVWNQNAGGGQGGIWMSGMALSSDGNRIFWVSGNGDGHENNLAAASGSSGCQTLGEAAVNLNIGAGGKLLLTDYFQPYDYQAMDGGDQDFGSGGVALLDPTVFKGTGVAKMAITAGKNGKIYVLNANNLGGYRLGSGQTDGIIQTITTNKPVFGGVGSYPLEGGYFYSTPVGYPTFAYKLGFDSAGVPVFSLAGQSHETSAGRVGVGIPTVTTNQGRAGSGIVWMTDPDAGLRAWYAVPGADGFLKSIKLPQVNGINKFQRPVFGDTRMYVSDAGGKVYCLGSPVNLPLNCTSPVDFGQVPLGSAANSTITCKAVIGMTSINGATVGDANFIVDNSTLPKGPLAAGASFSFPVKWDLTGTVVSNQPNASYGNRSPGVKSTALTLFTTNAVQGYSTSFPLSLTGVEVSQKAFLTTSPNTLDFGGVVILNASSVPTIKSPFVIGNAGLNPLTINGYAYTSTDLGNSPVFTNVSFGAGAVSLGTGFSSPNLPPIGTILNASTTVSVDATFNPTNGTGAYVSYLLVYSNGGQSEITLGGSASTAPIANFSISNGEGGWLPDANIIMDFGSVKPGTTTQRQIRICNVGGSALLISKSKPPNGVFHIADPAELHEEQPIAVGACAYGNVLMTVNTEEYNVLDIVYTNTWTLNTDDLNFGVHVVNITGKLVSNKVGPTNSSNLPVYTYLGCYSDNNAGYRLLPNQLYTGANNTNGNCQSLCYAKGYAFAGTEYQQECYCGNTPPSAQFLVAEGAYCTFTCTGDANDICGGNGGYLSVYYDATKSNGTSAGSGPAPKLSSGNYNYIGCYSDVPGRALTGNAPAAPAAGHTIETCEAGCQGYTFFGMEYANECYCGNAIAAASVNQSSANPTVNGCSMPCAGDQTELCGGPNRLEMYQINSTAPLPTTTSAGPNPPAPTPTGGPIIQPTAGGVYSYFACYTDNVNGRALAAKQNPESGAMNTVDACAAACVGYKYMGVEYGAECYCDNVIGGGNTLATGGSDPTANGCSMTCAGNSSTYCGGPNRLNIYSVNPNATYSMPTPTAAPTPTGTPTGPVTVGNFTVGNSTAWTYIGCYSEATAGRALSGLQNPIPANTVSVPACASACSAFSYFGVEYSGECYCGNTFGAGSALVAGATPAQTLCDMTCNGNTSTYCGGPNRLNMYSQVGGPPTVTSSTVAPGPTTPVPTPAGPITVTSLTGYSYLGCYSEATNTRALNGLQNPIPAANVSIEACAAACSAFAYFGTEYAGECYCGNVINTGSALVAGTSPGVTGCNMVCKANSTEYCGGGNRLNMYQVLASASSVVSSTTTLAPSTTVSLANTTIAGLNTTTVLSTTAVGTTVITTSALASSAPASSTPASSASASSAPSSSATTSSVPASSVLVSSALNTTSATPATTSSTTTTSSAATYLPTVGQTINNWAYLGCANETNPRALSSAGYTSNTGMTLESCQQFCSSSANNYGLAGLEFGGECFCGNGLQQYSAVGQTGCNMPCTGNSSEICGGSSRISVYNLTTFVPPTTVKAVGSYVIKGCYKEATNGRLLNGPRYTNNTAMTVESCVKFCSSQSPAQPYAGVEYAQECYCGSTLPAANTTTTVDISKCNMLCTGDKREFCGAGALLNVYHNEPSTVVSSTPAAMNSPNPATISANTVVPPTSSPSAAATMRRRRM